MHKEGEAPSPTRNSSRTAAAPHPPPLQTTVPGSPARKRSCQLNGRLRFWPPPCALSLPSWALCMKTRISQAGLELLIKQACKVRWPLQETGNWLPSTGPGKLRFFVRLYSMLACPSRKGKPRSPLHPTAAARAGVPAHARALSLSAPPSSSSPPHACAPHPARYL